MNVSDRLKLARENAGYATAADAARAFGWVEVTYRHHENGTRNPPRSAVEKYARAFRRSPEWILFGTGDDARKPVPLVGMVGAGAEVFPIDDGGSLEDIDPPPGVGPSAVAVKVTGDSMYPRYMAGDLLIYDSHVTAREAHGQECVVGLTDGRKLVKLVRYHPDRQTITLESWNTAPIYDAPVEWLAVIRWIRRAGG